MKKAMLAPWWIFTATLFLIGIALGYFLTWVVAGWKAGEERALDHIELVGDHFEPKPVYKDGITRGVPLPGAGMGEAPLPRATLKEALATKPRSYMPEQHVHAAIAVADTGGGDLLDAQQRSGTTCA